MLPAAAVTVPAHMKHKNQVFNFGKIFFSNSYTNCLRADELMAHYNNAPYFYLFIYTFSKMHPFTKTNPYSRKGEKSFHQKRTPSKKKNVCAVGQNSHSAETTGIEALKKIFSIT